MGFPGESEAQFRRTYDLLAELRLDKAHLARYSPRPHTLSARRMPDDVDEAEKKRRHRALESLQAGILADINARWLGQRVPVLVEERSKGRWRGRTPQNRLVFFEHRRRLSRPGHGRRNHLDRPMEPAGTFAASGNATRCAARRRLNAPPGQA